MLKKDKKFVKVLYQEDKYIEEISREFRISPIVSKVLLNRGLKSKEEIKKFLNPTYDDFHDPSLLKDMDNVTDRILRAIELDENIWIYGDYDVDGVTSTSLLINFFSQIGIEVDYYIPDRHKEGYGLNKDAVKFIREQKGNLIITVDCGITSVEEVKYCNELGMDIIITDHHTCGDRLPDAAGVINPNREDSNYPFKKLAGVGVAFKLVQSISREFKIDIDYLSLLPIVAIGTVADVVSLMGENRLIVKKGLELINKTTNLGIKALIEVTGLEGKEISGGHIGFIIGPRINAAGRMKHARKGVELFTSTNYEEALNIAKELDEENKYRQEIESRIFDEADELIRREGLDDDNVIVLSSNDWHHGVIGIVSSRITEKYYKPSVLISIDENNKGRGSARSISTLNIYDALNDSRDLFLGFGGHKLAAGLSIDKDNIDTFKNRVNSWVGKNLEPEDFCQEIVVDSVVEMEDISLNTVVNLDKLAPFGMGNSSPVFSFEDSIVKNIRSVGRNRSHLKLGILYKGMKIDCIGFNLGYMTDNINNLDLINIIGSLDINEYNGEKKVQILIKDIIKSDIELDIESKYNEDLNRILTNGLQKYSKDFAINDTKSIDKLDYVIERLKSNKKIKIYINNLMSLRDILNRMNKEGRDIFKNTYFNYFEEGQNRKNKIIINPRIKDIKNENCEKIILYDLPFSEEMYYTIKTVHDDVVVLCDDKDLKNNKEIISKFIPDIKELRNIYKSFKGNNIFKLNISKYILSLQNKDINMNEMKVQIAIKIFNEAKLLDYKEIDKNNYYVKLNEVSSKVNISDVPIFKEFRNYIS
ncbi:single-stranded-DNA-specific exonuclease RecJ [Clostridium sp. D2Q-14]|uniref:single-stranded-DNA-specific exonuclease RecJ n=1 Tax=Anaeromonas gelatinilytica TaxID=2683194 RepID=UPI00193C3149|nr:single-stranded-DNA-specific exonuclease RecJ [Anaeromonas gelatinilytica]MBS4534234.1 single-stranded-DNA-specific exonuclease RecJ [Anaeromonas gelatinilytica]